MDAREVALQAKALGLQEQAWNAANERLQALGILYRLRSTPNSQYIAIRQLEADGRVARQFSLRPLRVDSVEHIKEAMARCLDATNRGHWPGLAAQADPSLAGPAKRPSAGGVAVLPPLQTQAWKDANAKLKALKIPYRLRTVSRSPYVFIRQLKPDGTVLTEFSLQPLRAGRLEDIEEALARCLDAERAGYWPGKGPAPEKAPPATFAQLAALTLDHIQARLKASSSAHMRGHLKALAELPGQVTIDRLRDWVLEVPPSALSVYEKRLGTLAAMDQALQAGPERQQGLDLQPLVVELRARKPKGGELKRIKDARRKPKAIPSDEALEAWLDGLDDPLLQWVYGLIATYGLRPSEVWHVLPIDSHGWITVPGDQLTKTATHVAPALPMAWVERYGLRDRFGEMQERLLQRWQIQWTDLGGQRVPNNNTSLSNYLYKQFQLRGTPKLWARAWEGDGQDWCRPYDLRHAYAVRCWSHPEASAIPMAEHAEWMGHGLELHRSTYLRWMSPEARAAAARARAGHGQPAAAPALPDGITPELLALGRQLKALQG
jgi:integrase